MNRKAECKADGGVWDSNSRECFYPSCDDDFGNLIHHSSDFDGTHRSAKACFIIDHFGPKNAEQLGNILKNHYNEEWERFTAEGEEGLQYPMFRQDEELIEFCKEEVFGDEGWLSSEDAKQMKYNKCVGDIDTTDIVADVWKLSDEFQENYPSKEDKYMFGDYIGSGWHKALKELRNR